MKSLTALSSLVVTLFMTSTAWAQVPAAAPNGSTGLCKDGSYSSNATKKGACAGHKGVKDWYPASATVASPASAATTATAPAATKTVAAPMAQAPGGGAGQVWVNSASKVYHCSGSRYYGKTKQGEYMTEAAAKTAGDRPDHGKACS